MRTPLGVGRAMVKVRPRAHLSYAGLTNPWRALLGSNQQPLA
jgi:hypothetical protein